MLEVTLSPPQGTGDGTTEVTYTLAGSATGTDDYTHTIAPLVFAEGEG